LNHTTWCETASSTPSSDQISALWSLPPPLAEDAGLGHAQHRSRALAGQRRLVGHEAARQRERRDRRDVAAHLQDLDHEGVADRRQRRVIQRPRRLVPHPAVRQAAPGRLRARRPGDRLPALEAELVAAAPTGPVGGVEHRALGGLQHLHLPVLGRAPVTHQPHAHVERAFGHRRAEIDGLGHWPPASLRMIKHGLHQDRRGRPAERPSHVPVGGRGRAAVGARPRRLQADGVVEGMQSGRGVGHRSSVPGRAAGVDDLAGHRFLQSP